LLAACDQSRDSATSNLLQEILDETERRTWFLFAVVQGAGNTD
jgi:starvation-inducible DNA-binding protein